MVAPGQRELVARRDVGRLRRRRRRLAARVPPARRPALGRHLGGHARPCRRRAVAAFGEAPGGPARTAERSAPVQPLAVPTAPPGRRAPGRRSRSGRRRAAGPCRRAVPPGPAPLAPAPACARAARGARGGPRATVSAASLVSRTSATSRSSGGRGPGGSRPASSPSTSRARTVAGRAEPLGLVGHPLGGPVGQVDRARAPNSDRNASRSCATSALGQRRGRPGPAAVAAGDRRQRTGGVPVEQGLDERRRAARSPAATPPAATTWSRAESVSRAEPPPGARTWLDGLVARRRGRRRPTTHRTCSLELVGRQEVELEVLGAAADGRADLLRVGGGQHEHDVVGRLLERLQQRGLGGASRACGPRRGCTPCGAPACRASPCR